jgi:quercetin dioxygenase-like cupin family protein
MRRILTAIAIVLVTLMFTVGTAVAQDPIKVGPNIYKKLFENDRVRMLEVTFAPGDSIAMHSHPDHAVYTVTGGTLRVTTSDGKTMVADLKAGDPIWFPAVMHAAKNIGTTSLKLVVVELKEKPPTPTKEK